MQAYAKTLIIITWLYIIGAYLDAADVIEVTIAQLWYISASFSFVYLPAVGLFVLIVAARWVRDR